MAVHVRFFFWIILIHFNSSCVGCRCIAHTCDRNQSTKPSHDKILHTACMYNLYHEYLMWSYWKSAEKGVISHIKFQSSIGDACDVTFTGRKNAKVVKELSVNSQLSGSSRRSLVSPELVKQSRFLWQKGCHCSYYCKSYESYCKPFLGSQCLYQHVLDEAQQSLSFVFCPMVLICGQ